MRSIFIAASLTLVAIARSAGPHAQAALPPKPHFGGIWIPAEPARSEVLFNNGLGWAPGDGRISIEHTATRLTLTKHVPDAKLDRLLILHRRFYPTVIFALTDDGRGRAGGGGAGGLAVSVPSWDGERAVLSQEARDNRLTSTALVMDGGRLRLDIDVAIVAKPDQTSRTSEWFVKGK